jgi:CheY-like chemotaxis protein
MVGEQGAILLVEGWGRDIVLIEEAFKRAEIPNRLVIVRTGKEAVDYLEGNGEYSDRAHWPIPALLLLELRIQRLDGFAVLQWLRERAEFDGVIAVVFTVNYESHNVNRAYELGANSVPAKPADLRGLEEVCVLLVDFWLNHNVPAGLQNGA